MFARISIDENVDLDLADQVKQWVESLGTDPFGELPAYAADARADRDGFQDLVGGRIDPRDGAVGAVTDPHPAAASSPRRVVVSVDPTRSVNITVVMLLVRVLLMARCADFPTTGRAHKPGTCAPRSGRGCGAGWAPLSGAGGRCAPAGSRGSRA